MSDSESADRPTPAMYRLILRTLVNSSASGYTLHSAEHASARAMHERGWLPFRYTSGVSPRDFSLSLLNLLERLHPYHIAVHGLDFGSWVFAPGLVPLVFRPYGSVGIAAALPDVWLAAAPEAQRSATLVSGAPFSSVLNNDPIAFRTLSEMIAASVAVALNDSLPPESRPPKNRKISIRFADFG